MTYLRIAGLAIAIGTGTTAFMYFRSPLIGVLTVLGMVAAGVGKRHRTGTITILALVAALASAAPQTASANGGPFPHWYRVAVPVTCKAQGPADPSYAAWWIDPLYKSCLNTAGADWMTRCAVGATVGPVANVSGMAMTSKSWAMYASKIADLNPWGILAVAGTGCVLAQIKVG